MDISGISTSVSASSFAASSKVSAEFQNSELIEGARETRHEHEHGHHGRGRKGLALGAFKQELRIALQTEFHAKFTTMQQGYARQQEPVTSDDVAEEALGAAKRLVADEPARAAKSLISFRAKVEETASYVREAVGDSDDRAEVDDAVAKVDQGLAKMEDDVAANRESSASILEVDTRIKQRSRIQIRTQEGDIVRFSLRRIDGMSASEIAYADNDMSLTSTEIAVSSRSRMRLKVEGDLNQSEMAAIQNVFAQAEAIANEFFGGDIGAAFDSAQGFEFDNAQLARVNMQFRMRQLSNVSYVEAARPATNGPVVEPTVEQSSSRPVVLNSEMPAAADSPEVFAEAVEKQPEADDGKTVAKAIAAEDTNETSSPSTNALEDFFEQLSAFLRTVGEGFAGTSYNYHHSTSFKLNLLKVVMHTVAPDDADNSAKNVGSVIDQIAEDADPE